MRYFWTPDFHGVTHYTFVGNSTGTTFWASVEKFGDKFLVLTKYFPGCRFSPHVETFGTMQEAKNAAESYISKSIK